MRRLGEAEDVMLKISHGAEYANLIDWYCHIAEPGEVGARFPPSVRAAVVNAINKELDAFMADVKDDARIQAAALHRN